MRTSCIAALLACATLPVTALANEAAAPIKVLQQASHTAQTQTISGVLSVYWHEQTVKLAMNTDAASQQQLFRNTPKPKHIDHTRSDKKFVDLHWRGGNVR